MNRAILIGKLMTCFLINKSISSPTLLKNYIINLHCFHSVLKLEAFVLSENNIKSDNNTMLYNVSLLNVFHNVCNDILVYTKI